MLVGNDFLPHCPHLSIDGGALSLMLSAYTDLLPKMGGYMTKAEKIHPQRFQMFIDEVMKVRRRNKRSEAKRRETDELNANSVPHPAKHSRPVREELL